MLTNQQANALVNLPKKIVRGGKFLDRIPFRLTNGKARYDLLSDQARDHSFLLEITQATKGPQRGLKISLHFQENDDKIGLLRIDYFGQHKNPSAEDVKGFLPMELQQHVGRWFGYEDHHIHQYVVGYKDLVWAIPLKNDDFPYKSVSSVNDVHPIAQEFGKRINLITQLGAYQNVLA